MFIDIKMSTGPAFDGVNYDVPAGVITQAVAESGINITANVANTILFDTILSNNSDASETLLLSYSSGVFTNTSGRTATFLVNFSIYIYTTSSSYLNEVFIQKSPTSEKSYWIGSLGSSSSSNPICYVSSSLVVLKAGQSFSVKVLVPGVTTGFVKGYSPMSPSVASKIQITQIK